jgi:hypothetical protein
MRDIFPCMSCARGEGDAPLFNSASETSGRNTSLVVARQLADRKWRAPTGPLMVGKTLIMGLKPEIICHYLVE